MKNRIVNADKDWLKNRSKKRNLQSVASYFAMFPKNLPKYFIEKYSQEGNLIFDPFSGRGTTALECRFLNRNFVGSDLNPYAYILTKLKISSNLDKEKLINKVNKYQIEYEKYKKHYQLKTKNTQYKELKCYYHPQVLSQLLFIRKKMSIKCYQLSKYNLAIAAFALGIMHGPTRKNGTSMYFSVSMSNVFSLAPNYVKNYAQKNGLKINNGNIFKKIISRIEQKYDDVLKKKYNAKIFFHNAKNSFGKKIKNKSIDLLVTSPPYLNVVSYTNTNWLRLWLLGFNRKELKQKIHLDDNLNFDQYVVFIKKFLINIYDKMKPKSKVCLVVADIKSLKTIEEVWDKIENNVPYALYKIVYDNDYFSKRKTSYMLNSRKGKNVKIEKILILTTK